MQREVESQTKCNYKRRIQAKSTGFSILDDGDDILILQQISVLVDRKNEEWNVQRERDRFQLAVLSYA